MCKLLVQHKAPLNPLTQTQCAPLHIAVQQHSLSIVKLLVDAGAFVNISSLQPTPQSAPLLPPNPTQKHVRTLSASLFNKDAQQSSVPVTVTPSLTYVNIYIIIRSLSMPTPFIVACSLGLADIMNYLLAHGADAIDDKSDTTGHTPLMMVCENGHEDACGFLIAFIRKNHGEMKLRETINKKSLLHHLWSSLHFAASTGQFTICQVLLDNGAFLDSLDDVGRTPLHHASKNGHPEVVRLLIERGANVDIRDDVKVETGVKEEGKTAMDLASESLNYHRVQKAFKEALAKRQPQAAAPSYTKPSQLFLPNNGSPLPNKRLARWARTPSTDMEFFKNQTPLASKDTI